MIKFDDYVNAKNAEKIALLPGGFKPPTSGHFEAFKYLLNDCSRGIIFIGKKDRDDISALQSKAIWQIYSKYLNKPIDIQIADVTPVRSVYTFADDNMGIPIKVGAGAKDEDIVRYDGFTDNAEKYALVEVVKIPLQAGGISGSMTRELISTDIAAAINYFTPSVISTSDKELIMSILGVS